MLFWFAVSHTSLTAHHLLYVGCYMELVADGVAAGGNPYFNLEKSSVLQEVCRVTRMECWAIAAVGPVTDVL